MLVGRDRELALIAGALSSAGDGHGRLILIAGPPGIGKSALAEAAADLARRQGLGVERSYAIDDPGAPPLWPWTRLIRGWTGADELPSVEPGEPEASAQFALFAAIADVVATKAQAGPLLVILEDLHWADASSQHVLRHVAAGVPDLPLCVLVTYRDLPPVPALARLVGTDVSCPIELAGLSVEDVVRWLTNLVGGVDPGVAATVHEATDGNPLLVRLLAEDLAASGASEVTGRSLHRLAMVRMAALDPATRDVVDTAAVLGERVDAAILAEATGRDSVTDEVAAATAAGVLRSGPDGVAFEHALVRDAVYADLSTARRAAMHRQPATALEKHPDVPPGLIATHWLRADGPDAGDRSRVFASVQTTALALRSPTVTPSASPS